MEKTVKDLLTVEEKANYFELVATMERNKGTMTKKEIDKHYQQANEILLQAVKREIERRKNK